VTNYGNQPIRLVTQADACDPAAVLLIGGTDDEAWLLHRCVIDKATTGHRP
jgi:hypothetical protein